MAGPLPEPPPGFDEMSVEEQIEYLQSLWDRIAAGPERVPQPPWHDGVLKERSKAYEESPDDTLSWQEVRERVSRRLRERPD